MHTPLHLLPTGSSISTAGRIEVDDTGVWVANAHTRIRLLGEWDVRAGEMVRVHGEFGREALRPDAIESLGFTRAAAAFSAGPLVARHEMLRTIHSFFGQRSFLEVETPNLVDEPGTDVYLEPIATIDDEFLHTSPEFAMKRLLVDGFERIYQLAKVYRRGERGVLHHPEFTILEWYRAWEPVGSIIEDVEELVAGYLGLERPFERVTMQELFLDVLDIDILRHVSADGLRKRCLETGVLEPKPDRRWDEIFFELMVTHIDEALKSRGPVFVTHWPASQAVLARKDPEDLRVALRFELYVDGLELANGFEELRDPDEQRARFASDVAARRAQGLQELPMPEAFLADLERGMPPASGVAMGLDRLLMKKMGVDRIDLVAPFIRR